jgi:flagellar biosynthesis/type III secretory pathway protein FliH
MSNEEKTEEYDKGYHRGYGKGYNKGYDEGVQSQDFGTDYERGYEDGIDFILDDNYEGLIDHLKSIQLSSYEMDKFKEAISEGLGIKL